MTLLYIVGFVRTILIIAIIYIIIKWISKLMNPPQTQQKKKQSKAQKPEGETTIRYNKKGEKIVDKDKGEYVDFEEVQD